MGHAELLALAAVHPAERGVEAARPQEGAGVGQLASGEAVTQAAARDLARGGHIRETDGDDITTQPNAAALAAEVRPKGAERLEEFDVGGGEPGADDAGLDERPSIAGVTSSVIRPAFPDLWGIRSEL
ncbi:MAG TPA: hypothetical protein VFQ38_21075 [Longimicrobiales bacterium]|nr:hypothetical protein [Longimicrobiales bacterium]